MTERTKRTGEGLWPGEPKRDDLVERIIRVDQAGEFGAVRIYAGQMAVLGRSASAPLIERMAAQEQRHLDRFNEMIAERRVRPTVFSPLWHFAGYALGATTALMGERAAMACTVAVEEVIDQHYARQAELLGDDESELRETIMEFRMDELEHRDTALRHEARQAPAYEPLTFAVKTASRLAIWLSERF